MNASLLPSHALFDVLAPSRRELWLQQVTPFSWTIGDLIHPPGERIETVILVERGLLSNSIPLGPEPTFHAPEEVFLASHVCGRGQVSALACALSDKPSLFRCTAQLDGNGWQLPAPVLREEFARGGELQRVLLRELERQLGHAAQRSLCNRLHTVEERLACWLLEIADATGEEAFPLSRQFLAAMLGARASSVPLAVGALWRAGLLDCQDETITISDRARLEETSCSCYEAQKMRA